MSLPSSSSITTTTPAASPSSTNINPSSSAQQQEQEQPQLTTTPKRYIFNDDDLQHFLQSPSKRALLQFTAAMGQSCCSTTATSQSFVYDPNHPLRGLSLSMACLHGAMDGMMEWVQTDFAVSSTPSTSRPTGPMIRFGNPLFREWHQRLIQRAPTIVRAILYESSSSSSSMRAEDQQYQEALLLEASERGRIAATTADTTTTTTTDHDSANTSDADDEDNNNIVVIQELCAYLQDAFGQPIRLDFGTGHETSFQIFLFALCKLNCFGSGSDGSGGRNHQQSVEEEDGSQPPPTVKPPTPERMKAITLSIYHQYLQLTHTLLMEYKLEPAGSHGVWGLDDHYCLPFYFGACQLQGMSSSSTHHDDNTQHVVSTTPMSIHDETLVRENANRYLYFRCIHFIKTLKRGVPFFESSPMLNDISQLPSWTKVAAGLLKLYEGEVLSKRQVVQHLVFGNVCFPANWIPSQTSPLIPPSENFRTTSATTTTAPAPWVEARAPWSK